jgi:uncharacterized protein (DUF58 family)
VRFATAVFLAVAGAVVAVLIGRPDAAVLVSPWAVLLALGLSGTRRPAATGAVTAGRDRVLAGEELTVTATISGARGWVETTCQPEGTTAVADVAQPDRPTELRHTVTTSDWGSHDLGRVDLTIHEPYGLIDWVGSLHTPAMVRVHPGPISANELLTPRLVRRLTGSHLSPAIGRGIEYADIRPFGSGDSLRDINWRASARSDELWVSERHPDRATDVVLLLDTFTESGHDVRRVLGLAVEAAVTLAESHLAVNDRVGVIEVGGIIRWVGLGTGRHQLQRLTDALLETRLYENAADRPLTAIPPRALPPRSFVVALSPLLDERFVATVMTLRGAGHDVSVIEHPPIPPEALLERSESEVSAVALRIWEAERQMLRDRMAQQGVVVGRWADGEHLDQVLASITARRRGQRSGARQ